MEDLKLEDDAHVPQAFGVGPIPRFLASRELGMVGKRHMSYVPPKEPSFEEIIRGPRGSLLLDPVEISPGLKNGSSQTSARRHADEVGEERLVVKELETLPCKLNGTHTRSTFLMVFSPDKELLASTHGDHNIYVTEVKTGKCVRTLSGHPRTPWCIAFHPSYTTVLASGCLGGLVRVWDILSGGSEVWRTDGVIASLAFHPFDRLLVVATFNELHFWDWSAASRPFAKVRTNSDKEKVRYVKFDSMGHNLITGIANLCVPRNAVPTSNATATSGSTGPSNASGPSDRLMWVRTSGHSEFAAEHLYGGNLINRSRNLPFYHSEMAMPRYGRYRRFAYTAQSPSSNGSNAGAGRTIDRGTDPMLSSTSTNASSFLTRPSMLPGRAGHAQGQQLRRTNNSASQTLSDLAAAASNQLMAENAAAAAAAASASGDVYYPSFDRWSSRISSLSNQSNSSASASTATSTSAATTATTAAVASGRDLTDPSLPFTHSPQSSFREVAGVGEGQDEEETNSLPSSTGATAGGDVGGAGESDERIVYLQRRTERNSRLQARLQAATNDRLREYRIQELLERRESLVSQIHELRTARDILTSQNGNNSTTASTSMTGSVASDSTRRTTGMSPTLPTSDPLFEPPTRPIDEWAINRRLSLESSQLSESVDELRHGRFSSATERNSNVRATLLIDYLNRDPVLGNINGATAEPEPNSNSLESPLRPPPAMAIEPAVMAEPESMNQVGRESSVAEAEQIRNDHTYVQRPRDGGQALEDDLDLDLDRPLNLDPAQNSSGSTSNGNLLGNHNMDIVLLSRHIAHMQRICRTSLQDCTRQRRQVVRLQSIRRMLEDLQRQIRSLRAASLEELQRRNNPTNSSTENDRQADEFVGGQASSNPRPRSNGSVISENEAAAASAATENLVRTSPGNLLDDRNYDERAGEGEHLAQLRSNSLMINSTLSRLNRAASSAAPSVTRRTGPLSGTALRSGRSPSSLMRAHNRFLSQMRATFRALEMSPDLARTGNSPINQSNAEVSRNVMESLQAASAPSQTSTTTTTTTSAAASTTATTSSLSSLGEANNTRGELRALSQRLEMELRARRESSGGDLQTRLELEESRRVEPGSRPWLFTNTFLESESESDSDTGRGNLESSSTLTGPARYLPWFNSSSGQSDMYDIYSNYPPPAGVGSRRPTTSRNLLSGSERWRTSSIQERVDTWRELRRDAIRERQRLSRERDVLRRRRRHRLLDSQPYMLNPSYRYTFHRNYPGISSAFDQQDEEDDLDQESSEIPRPRPSETSTSNDVIAVDDEDEASANVAAGGGSGAGGTSNNERLPPLRELIWRRLRRRNAQLNMLDEELSGNNTADAPRGSGAIERSTRHRELLSWMVDQMRLDHVPASSSALGSAGTSSESGALEREPPPLIRLTPDSPPRFTIRVRRNAENSASDNSPTVATGVGNNPGPNISTSARVILPGINPPLPSVNGSYRISQQRDQQHFFLSSAPSSMLLTHRIQAWDFSRGDLPDISDENKNVIVKEAKIHNDASVDISEDGTILVTLVPSNLPMTTVVGVYGLQPDSNRGRCYATYSLESSAVSVSLSPTSRHLLVGLAIRAGRITLSPADRSLMAQIFRIKLPWDRNAERGRLVHRRDIHQTHEQGQTSLNCIRWIPVAGQGIVYATNTGLLKILR